MADEGDEMPLHVVTVATMALAVHRALDRAKPGPKECGQRLATGLGVAEHPGAGTTSEVIEFLLAFLAVGAVAHHDLAAPHPVRSLTDRALAVPALTPATLCLVHRRSPSLV